MDFGDLDTVWPSKICVKLRKQIKKFYNSSSGSQSGQAQLRQDKFISMAHFRGKTIPNPKQCCAWKKTKTVI